MFDKEWLSSDRDLVAQYQSYLNRDEVIATMKKRYFNALLKKARETSYAKVLDEWDLQSYLFESTHVALTTYDLTMETIFFSYLKKIYMNRLRTEAQYLSASTLNRNWFATYEDGNSTINRDGEEYSLFDKGVGCEQYTGIDHVNLVETIKTFDLTVNQRKYVDYLLECTYIPSDAEAGRELHISRVAVGKLKKSLKNKMASLI